MKRYPLAILAAAWMLTVGFDAQAEKLVLLHTNDTHSQIDPFPEDNLGGIARRKVLIDSVRNAEENVLLIDAGDIVQGTLFFNLYKGEVEEKLMNALGYDMRILGNHEFDNGMQALADNLAVADAELLCANYDFRNTPLKDTFKPYSIKEVDGKRIAFLPINLQPKGMIADANCEGVGFIDEIEAANGLAWYLKNIEHADMVVVISHIGYDDDVKLIENSHDIDLLIGGHSHTLVNPADPNTPPYLIKNADGREIVVAQAGKGARYLGEITIDLDDLAATPDYQLILVDDRLDSRVGPEVEEIVSPYRAEVDALNKKQVTKAAKYLKKDSPEMVNFASDFVEWKGKELNPDVDLVIMNKGGIRNDVDKGPVSEGQVITLMPFFNRIVVIEVPGDSLIEAFNNMTRIGGAGLSKNVKAVYDKNTGTWEELTISGQPIDPNRNYKIATIDYVANGGDYFHSLVDHKTLGTSKNYAFDDLLEYFRTGPGKGKSINPPSERRLVLKK
ncbi:MAG: bifunctional metallophosphatase/5'-nucleotidase [Bacteroidales bacterium]|nr:bifunctional metallophosphatase/5'-nucleotidase [Bacteroidales bacterium]